MIDLDVIVTIYRYSEIEIWHWRPEGVALPKNVYPYYDGTAKPLSSLAKHSKTLPLLAKNWHKIPAKVHTLALPLVAH